MSEGDSGKIVLEVPGRGRGAGKGGAVSWTVALLCLCVSILSSAVTLLVYDRLYAQKIVAVDVKGFLAERRDQFLAGKITEADIRMSLDRLEEMVNGLPKNRVVLMFPPEEFGALVVRNVPYVSPNP